MFWYNLFKSGEGDYRTRHAACPVLVGSKWGKLRFITVFNYYIEWEGIIFGESLVIMSLTITENRAVFFV